MDGTKRFGLLTAALLAAAFSACSSTVNTNTGGSGGSGGCADTAHCAPSCPATLPAEGSPCSVEGQVCGDVDECGYGDQAVCTNGTWGIVYYDPGPMGCGCGVPCTSPCPPTKPAGGSACDGEGTVCNYADPSCSEGGSTATCSGGTWQVDYYGPDCWPTCPTALPVAGDPCDGCCLAANCSYLDDTGCAAHVSCENGAWVIDHDTCTPVSDCSSLSMTQCFNANGCRWIAFPYCTESPEDFPQGCYPVSDCTADTDCPPGDTCKQVEVDPCPGGDCGQCSKSAAICVP